MKTELERLIHHASEAAMLLMQLRYGFDLTDEIKACAHELIQSLAKDDIARLVASAQAGKGE